MGTCIHLPATDEHIAEWRATLPKKARIQRVEVSGASGMRAMLQATWWEAWNGR